LIATTNGRSPATPLEELELLEEELELELLDDELEELFEELELLDDELDDEELEGVGVLPPQPARAIDTSAVISQ